MSLFLPPNVRATDGNNVIINGAKWSFTLTGTTTPASVYTTSALSVAHTNPVVCNSVGRFPPIYRDPAVTYRVRLLDASDVVVPGYDIDPYSVDTASDIQFLPSGTGATASTVQTYLRLFKSDLGFATLQEALTAAAGNVLHLTQAWSYAGGATVPANTTVLGMGGSITVTADNANGLIPSGDNIIIDQVKIVGPALSTTPSSEIVACGIYATGRTNVKIQNCTISAFTSCGILLRNCPDASVTGNRFYSNYNGAADSSDISLYSSAASGRTTIHDNRCLSNNSQGIYVSVIGCDENVVVSDNHCVATTAGGAEIGVGTLVRRHGIIAGYTGVAGNGRFLVFGNICRNTGWTGIYVAADTHLRRAVSITNNVCSLNGLNSTASAGLSGGIFLTGGGRGVIVANNTIYDYQGAIAQDCGSITVNHTVTGATAQIIGNTCDTSTADGIILKGSCIGVMVAENRIYAPARYGIYELNTAAVTTSGGHHIEGNMIERTTTAYPAIYVESQASTLATYIRGNRLLGSDETVDTAANANSGIFINGGVATKPVVVEANVIRKFYKGVTLNGHITGRNVLQRFDRNDFDTCNTAFIISAAATSGCMVVEGNKFSTVTATFAAGALGGSSVGYVGENKNGRLVLLDQTAAPATGTWVTGDTALFTAPAAGGVPGSNCTTGGNPGTWKSHAAIAA